MLRILKYIWQLPQNIIGAIYSLKGDAERIDCSHKDCRYFSHNGGSVSLGDYVFISNGSNTNTINHEYGHHRQSLYLGPFYLLLIGLPSVIGFWVDIWYHCDWSYDRRDRWYYNLPWEKWADKLGNVKRFF